MKQLLPVSIIICLVFLAPLSALANEAPEMVKMTASMGDVSFNHAAHQQSVGDCLTCHHAGLDAGGCKTCHGVKADAPKAKNAFHKLCKDCHKEQNGPTKCKACHIK